MDDLFPGRTRWGRVKKTLYCQITFLLGKRKAGGALLFHALVGRKRGRSGRKGENVLEDPFELTFGKVGVWVFVKSPNT